MGGVYLPHSIETNAKGSEQKAKIQFEGQLADADTQLGALWVKWDAALDTQDEAALTEAKDQMVALLDRRRYVRNLVRSVNEALEG